MIGSNEANIKAVITADDKASSVLSKFGDHVNGVAGAVGTGLKVAAEGLAIAGAAAIGFGVVSVKAFSESQDMIAQTNAVLKSTGGIAGVTAQQVDELSKALQKTTKFSDEQVRSAENLLLTFTSIGKDIFPQATATVLDMATALGEDTKSASIQLGKALQDPILGITALRRVGVNFSDAQKEVIKNLVDTNQKAAAQKLILKELQVEFGGSAVAAGGTFAGSLAKLKNAFNDIQETIGQTIVTAITPFIQKMAEFVSKVDWIGVINNAKTVLRLFFDTLTGGDPTIRKGEERFATLARTLSNLQTKFFEIRDAVIKAYQQIEAYLQPKLEALWHTVENDLAPALHKLWKDTLLPLIEALSPAVGVGLVWAVGLAIDILNGVIKVISAAITWFNDHKTAVLALAAAFGTLVAAMAIGAAISAIQVGFATLTLITIPSLIATLGALGAAFVAALPVVAVAAAAAAIVASIYTIKGAWDAVNASARAANNLGNEDQMRDLQKQAAAARAIGDTAAVNRISNALKALGGNARGTSFWSGGRTVVGEEGAEIVDLPQGSRIYPHDKSVDMASGGAAVINISINANAFMGSQIEARKFAEDIIRNMKDIAAKQNKTVANLMGAS